jgi:UDP:flavonoid glycosyltransferase YjiC (YdhE family)
MRILMATRGSAGHVGPLVPFAHACLRAGHEVVVAAQRQHGANVERAGLALAPVGDPPQDEWMPLMEHFARLGVDAATELMVGRFFGRIDVAAALPGLGAIVEDLRPDVIVRESWEFASSLVAEQHGIPVVRVGLGLAAIEQLSIGWAAAAVDEARAEIGLPPDPGGDRLREAPYLTVMPERLEDPATPAPLLTHRFRAPSADAAAPLVDWWPGNDDPLVYVTFGSVTAAEHLPFYPALYRDAIATLARLPARVLVTVGEDRDHRELGPLASNVRVERWVPQDAVAPHAAAIVCHGGYGSTVGALAHGVPLVVLPLFSGDQWASAAAVARAGAGIAVDADRATHRVFDLPGPDRYERLAAAVRRVLGDARYRREARRIADAMAALPPVDAAVDVLAALRARSAPRAGRPAY